MPRTPFPGTITAIEAQVKTRKHLGERVNVFVNDRFSFALAAELVSRYNLHPGVMLDAARLNALLREDGDSRAYARGLHFLSYRTRSSKEIRERLKRDEWTDEVIERAIERLQREGLLDDSHFAEVWVEHRSLSRPRGANALRQELRQKGVARETIDAALPDANQELDNAVAAVERKLRSWEKLDERTRRTKALEFLQRRGFNYGTARAALQRFEEEADDTA
jgi:regulatory protein